MPTLDRTRYAPATGVARGAYVLVDPPRGEPEVILIATGSEVSLCVAAYEELTAEGVRARVVSMPSWELFERQPEPYREGVLPPAITARVAVEQASTFGWREYVGPLGEVIGLIRDVDANVIYLAGPGHGGPALLANAYLEGTYSEIYPAITRDADGMQRLFRQFSTPGGVPSHVSVPTPGSIHEGGELGYVLVHAFGAVFDNPDLLAVAVIGDGEAETGPLEGSWKGIHFLDPARDGAVLPIPAPLGMLESWMRSCRPEELFDDGGRLVPGLAALAPSGDRRMSANPHANGGKLLVDLDLPDFTEYALPVPRPATEHHESTRQLGLLLRDVFRRNARQRNFRLFCPDETNSNRLGAVFEVENRCFGGPVLDIDDHIARDGRVMEVLSEHSCEGWLEGYLLTGRHGLFATYEAFAMISASMTVQHAKWLDDGLQVPWGRPSASLNPLPTSPLVR